MTKTEEATSLITRMLKKPVLKKFHLNSNGRLTEISKGLSLQAERKNVPYIVED